MTDKLALTYVEIDLPQCTLDYGVSPCTAELGVTGSKKCYRCPAACQDPQNYDPGTLTLRFAIATDYLPAEIPCIPSLRSVSITPQILDPGESMGQRESVTASFDDHPFNDVGIDKYHAERGFDPYKQGTFWPKMVARWPYMQGFAFRVIQGFLGQTLGEMETRHYIIESTAGPGSNNTFSITAKDYLKLLDSNKAQAPRPSNGVLISAIDEDDASLTLSPAGIGNLEYPASGFASIGDELVQYTRSGDTVTLVARGVDFSEISEHEEGETFQVCLFYDGEDAADIIHDLSTNYGSLNTSWINLPVWQDETSTYIGRLYSAKITKPTGVGKLINELINQVGLVMGSDVVNQNIFMYALRQFAPLKTIDDSSRLQDKFNIIEQQDKRVNLAITYYGQKNPLENLDDEKNYRCIRARLGETDISSLEGRQLAIRKIFSRWISVNNGAAADALNDVIIQRYQNAPRKFEDQLHITDVPVIATAATFINRNLQDDEGFVSGSVAQILSVKKTESNYSITAEEMTFVQSPVTDHIITIDSDTFEFNLRAVHDQIYAEAQDGDNVVCIISPGVTVGSNAIRSFTVGDWNSGVNITLINKGRILGFGGRGGLSGEVNKSGRPGGDAFRTRYPISIDNSEGQIWGGGGGGAGFEIVGFGGNGGGGAGKPPGTSSGTGFPPATETAGGQGSSGAGDGGNPGQAGENSSFGTTGGAAGRAVDGESFITWIAEGNILGARVN
jgi:hypothetical protein